MRWKIVLVTAVLVAGCGARVTPHQVQTLGGAGQATKMVNQTRVATGLAVLAEACAFAERAGIDAEKIPEALAGGRADSSGAARDDSHLAGQVGVGGQGGEGLSHAPGPPGG